ncbi:MAG: 50S ribosomal protein L5 [bacterium]|nr:50S ribosomal protein L5 [bacterium]
MQETYKEKVIPALMEKLKLTNPMQVPKLVKIVINVGVGKGHEEAKLLESVVGEVSSITGMKPIVTKAKKSISNFKLREGMPIGVKTTLRRTVMWEFLDRFFNLAVPRIRDFRGVSDKSFDGRGNYTLGIKEQIIFPEINYDSVEKLHGMDITFVTTALNDEHARELLRELGMPFRKKAEAVVK